MSQASSSGASSSGATSSGAPARGALQSGVSGGDTRRGEDGAAETPVVNPDAPVVLAPASAAVGIPQAEEPEPVDAAEAPSLVRVAVATVTEDGVKVFRDDEAAELLRGRGRAAGHLPVATASPACGVGMLVPPEGNGEYLTAGQVEKLLHAAYMRGRNEAVAAKIEADTSIRTLPQHGDVLFSTRPSVWGRVR